MMATMASKRRTDGGGRSAGEAPPVDAWLLDAYRDDYADLVRLAALLLDDRESAEEAVQDAFVAVARRRARGALRDPDATLPYLRSAVLNNARSALRKRGVRRRHLRSVGPPASAPSADHRVEADDDARRVAAVLRTLPPRQREVLVLRYWSDLSEAEIADALGISAGSVKTHAHRALQAMARGLETP